MWKLTFIACSVLLLSSCNFQVEGIQKMSNEVIEVPGGIHADVIPFDMNDGINSSDLIAEVRIDKKIKEIDENPLPYTVFSAVVENVYKGELKDREITIKQDGTSVWTVNDNALFKPGEKYILFLKETKSSKSDYWIIGEETGMFKVVDTDKVIKLADKLTELQSIETNKNSIASNEKVDDHMQVLDKNKFIEKIKEMLDTNAE